jgi:hypothetical protein
MLRVLRHTLIIVLIATYSAGAGATVLRLFLLPGAASSGAHAVKEWSNNGKEPRRPAWTQRRHLPLVHQISLSPAEPATAILQPHTARHVRHFTPAISLFVDFDYYSSRCNKAPPRA